MLQTIIAVGMKLQSHNYNILKNINIYYAVKLKFNLLLYCACIKAAQNVTFKLHII